MIAEGSFFATALSLVGFMPARRHEPPAALASMPDPACRPTMTDSPGQPPASMPSKPAKPMADIPAINARSNVIDISAMARIPDTPAIAFFIEEWIEYGVESAASLDALVRDYKAMRETYSFLPPVSKKRLSQLLVRHGCRKFVSDERDGEGQRHRVVFFDLRQSRAATTRRAA